jgi:hypothetical protein
MCGFPHEVVLHHALEVEVVGEGLALGRRRCLHRSDGTRQCDDLLRAFGAETLGEPGGDRAH